MNYLCDDCQQKVSCSGHVTQYSTYLARERRAIWHIQCLFSINIIGIYSICIIYETINREFITCRNCAFPLMVNVLMNI